MYSIILSENVEKKKEFNNLKASKPLAMVTCSLKVIISKEAWYLYIFLILSLFVIFCLTWITIEKIYGFPVSSSP